MTDRRMSEDELETLFAAGRAARAEPPEALMARVLDAAMTQNAPLPPRMPARRRGRLAGLVAGLGGWPALGGLATAGLVGVWIGYAAPGGVDMLRAAMPGAEYGLADMVPSLDGYLAEG